MSYQNALVEEEHEPVKVREELRAPDPASVQRGLEVGRKVLALHDALRDVLAGVKLIRDIWHSLIWLAIFVFKVTLWKFAFLSRM